MTVVTLILLALMLYSMRGMLWRPQRFCRNKQQQHTCCLRMLHPQMWRSVWWCCAAGCWAAGCWRPAGQTWGALIIVEALRPREMFQTAVASNLSDSVRSSFDSVPSRGAAASHGAWCWARRCLQRASCGVSW